MTANAPKNVRRVVTQRPGKPDDVFICCASFEARCLGSLQRFSQYEYRHAYVFVYDHPDERRDEHLRQMKQLLSSSGPSEEVPASELDPIPTTRLLRERLSSLDLKPGQHTATVDITGFTKRHLLLLLRMLDDIGLWPALRLLYTEPRDYVTDLYSPMSFGLREISPIPGFGGQEFPSKPLLLVIFLGYEGDRALALFENLDPNEAILVVPRPAYHPEWEGRTEALNRALISLVGTKQVIYADSRDPLRVASTLASLLGNPRYAANKFNCHVSPLGTKPQVVGLYLYWRQHRREIAVIYAQPLRHNRRFYSHGVGKTWILPIA